MAIGARERSEPCPSAGTKDKSPEGVVLTTPGGDSGD